MCVRISARSACPIQGDLERVADRRGVAAAGLELMDDLATGLRALRTAHVRRLPRGGTVRDPAVGHRHLIEDRAIEDDHARVVGVDMADRGPYGSGVGVRVCELLARRRHSAVRVPVMLGWTVQTNW